ncbi:urease accessory protein UreF [Microbispora sp. NPDC049125]|uniref:urease accessory protein UreF n=1 Tax=Microbispora sp. NPDC049125 TaxID=3154929 RepID=UPI003466A34F
MHGPANGHGPAHDPPQGRSQGDAALLLLADSRLPAGGHAHSGGAEEAVRLGTITGPEDLARFLRGRLATAGLVTAALAAAACELGTTTAGRPRHRHHPSADGSGGAHSPPAESAEGDDEQIGLWRRLDAETDARTASPAQREASRTQGRLLLRTARRMWPSPILDTLGRAVPEGPHHSVALGAAAASAGCDPYQAALAAAYNSVTGPATAAVRLLGLDPVTVHRLLADLAPALNDAAHAACASLIDAVVMDLDPAAVDPLAVDPLTDDPLAGDPLAGDPPATGSLATGPLGEPQAVGLAGREPVGAGETDGVPPDGPDDGSPPWRGRAWPALPGHAAPALDLLAEGHHNNTMKLFVS